MRYERSFSIGFSLSNPALFSGFSVEERNELKEAGRRSAAEEAIAAGEKSEVKLVKTGADKIKHRDDEVSPWTSEHVLQLEGPLGLHVSLHDKLTYSALLLFLVLELNLQADNPYLLVSIAQSSSLNWLD